MQSFGKLMALAGLLLGFSLYPQLAASQGRPSQAPPSGTHASSPAAHSRRPVHHAGDWLRKYKDLPPDQQQKALENDPQFRKLPPDRQILLQQQLRRFSSLPPERQKIILRRMETWEHLTDAQKKAAKTVFTKIRQLPPARRKLMAGAIRDLRKMDPQQREQALNSSEYHTKFSNQELDLLKGVLKLPLAPVHAENQQPPAPAAAAQPQ
ncbi:MAG: DUF3106 domain-containing protein [Chlamydiota bacterium]